MGHYVRVFCRSKKLPVIEKILTALNKTGRGFHLTAGPGSDAVEEENWSQLYLQYKEGKLPLIIKINRPEDEDGLFRSEIQDFIEIIGSPGLSLRKRGVTYHLQNSRYIVACQIPAPDIDQDGYDAAWYFCQYFVSHAAGLVQADGQGFYRGNKVIVSTE